MTRNQPKARLTRRRALQAMTATPLAIAAATPAAASAPTGNFIYEIQRTEAEWRSLLNETEYFVMREGGTEVPHSSLNTFEVRDGHYRCKGCDLAVFTSDWKVQHFNIGWTFFSQSIPNAILTSIDEDFRNAAMGQGTKSATIECHCRRCGSHFGHILKVKGQVLHCLNGASLVFEPTAT